jgi:hypothetical protein
LKRKARLYD